MDSNTDIITGIVMVGFFAVMGGFLGFTLGQDAQLNSMRETYKTCLVAYHETDGASEKACGDAQDATSTEFLCNREGYCWLEVK